VIELFCKLNDLPDPGGLCLFLWENIARGFFLKRNETIKAKSQVFCSPKEGEKN